MAEKSTESTRPAGGKASVAGTVARPAPGGPAGDAKPEASDVSAGKGPVIHFGPVR